MINRIVVFTGSKKDFERFINSRISPDENTIPFMELIQHYNARLRPNESGVRESALSKKISVDNVVVRMDDYGSVLDHVMSNFANIVGLNHEIETLYVQNPPRRALESLQTASRGEIEYHGTEYYSIDRSVLSNAYQRLCKDVLGQEECKKQIISGIYRLSTLKNEKPVVLLLYGPSGVGKTETAKSISASLGGELLRIQFSMMQTNEAYNYVFGAEHSKSSFARELLGRETNVILIDEFDKVNPVFYNAFYQLFDDGIFTDTNYTVHLENSIFLCTCNFASEDEAKKALGPAMFSRIGSCIKYDELSVENKHEIIDSWYNSIVCQLRDDEKEFIDATDIRQWFMDNANRYDNIRTLKAKLENAVFDELAEHFIISTEQNFQKQSPT